MKWYGKRMSETRTTLAAHSEGDRTQCLLEASRAASIRWNGSAKLLRKRLLVAA